MRLFKWLLNFVVLVVVIFVAGGFLLPTTWTVMRSTTMHATTDHIYPLVANFKMWETWAPWGKAQDPSIQYTYSGPEEGLGAMQSWTSEKMGKGSMELTAADPKTGVSYNLHIDMGWTQSTVQGKIEFAPEGDLTNVTWTDSGEAQGYVQRWMGLITKLMLGHKLETGLAQLKAKAEA